MFSRFVPGLGARRSALGNPETDNAERRTPNAGPGSWLTRRHLLGLGGVLGLGGLVPTSRAVADQARRAATPAVVTPAAPAIEPNVYKAIGVRPLINCRGTLTVIGGSMELPEVRAAKSAANQQHAQLDEVMAAVGKRLAELTGAEWGMVSAGCAAAMSHATAACVAGGNPDLHVRLPNLAGFAKDEVIIPTHSRNVYDAAIRAVGVKIIEVDTPEALQLAIGPRTAMIYIFAGPRVDAGPLTTEAIAAIAKPHNVPIFVDAAAEILTIPSVHLQKGATLVGYSGGKFIRGPQSAGLMLGRKDLVQAAWVHSAPHHGYARAMKVGREEMIGMLVAVESWVKRDHAAEWKEWVARCDYIADRVSKIAGVTATVVREPGASLSNRSPRVAIRWESQKLGITGADVSDLLDKGEPRIALAGGGGGGGGGGRGGGQELPGDTGISITSAMMGTGDEKIVAQRIVEVLSAKHTLKPAEPVVPPVSNLAGRWDVEIRFTASNTIHSLHVQQNGNRLEGIHQGNFLTRDIAGTISGDNVTLASNVAERHGDSLNYRFTGKVSGETMSGTLDMGEYLGATWSAKRPSART
jgi:L-seryl-tRNA(Ser) seleniumtransferase